MAGASCRALCVAAAILMLPAAPAAAADSSGPAKQLVTAMREAGLDAIAARDPAAPDRFIAALAFPDSQLLVVAAPSPAPDALAQALAQRRYRDVYTALQQPSIKDGKLFVQDLGCDGLQGTDGSVDVVYQDVTTQTIFNGDWRRQQLSEDEYRKRYRDTDARYSRMLSALLEATQAAAQGPAR